VQADPTAWRCIALLTTLHLDTAVGAADDLMIRDNTLRLVAILLRLGGCRVGDVADDPIEIHANQEELAAMANMARMTAGAILRRLAQEGRIDLSYRHLRILDPGALRAMLRRD
jgi:CRP/FNR family cyclic AMP-dependent transcriptional regulator